MNAPWTILVIHRTAPERSPAGAVDKKWGTKRSRAKTGKKLWRYNLGAGVNAPPITYEVNGTQYVAVAAGGNYQIDFPRGDTVAIFALNKNDQQQASK